MTDVKWQQYLIRPDKNINLSDWDPESTPAWKSDKDEAEKYIQKLNTELETLQELLFAQGSIRFWSSCKAWIPAGRMA